MRPVRNRGLLGADAAHDISVARLDGSSRTLEPRAAPSVPAESQPAWMTIPQRDLRPLNAPLPLRIDLDRHGRVVALWRQGRLTPRTIAAVQDQWRIDDEWWREHPISRMYYELLLDDGTLLTVYHDLLADAWFEQRS